MYLYNSHKGTHYSMQIEASHLIHAIKASSLVKSLSYPRNTSLSLLKKLEYLLAFIKRNTGSIEEELEGIQESWEEAENKTIKRGL